MTKHIRIENADNSPYKVNVEIWQIGTEGEPHTLFRTVQLDYPTNLTELLVHSHQYLVVKENGERT